MILLYLLFSVLLSGVGFLLYHFWLKKQGSIWQRKYFIYTIIAISLIMPIFLLETVPLFETNVPHTNVEFHNEPIVDAKLLACYARVSTQEGFCHCERLQQINLVKYKSNAFYDTWLQLQMPFLWGWLAIAGVLFLFLVGKIFRLIQFVQRYPKEHRLINEKSYYLLSTVDHPVAASFCLWNGYILWHPKLNLLSPIEQAAILQHEVAHINHRDTFELIGLGLLKMVWFMNPVFYWIKQELELLNEYLADAYAVKQTGNVKLYATLLIKLKEQQKLMLAYGFNQSPLRSRILTLFKKQPPKRHLFLPFLFTICISMALTGFSAAPYLNQKCGNFEEYCYLKNEYQASGKSLFCRNCLYEDLNYSNNK